MHDVAGLRGTGLQSLDDIGVTALRYEQMSWLSDFGDGQIETGGKIAHLGLTI